MFDKYLIGENSLQNSGPAAAPTGFSFQARLGYYRSLGLSMVEDLTVIVDGEKVPRSDLKLIVGSFALTLEQMETAYDLRWGFGEWAAISVQKVGGLLPGEHRVELLEQLRISYLPFLLTAKDEKVIKLQSIPHG